jgi:hypothetical protein
LEEIEKQQIEETKQREFLLKVAQKKIETEVRTQKNVEKRKKAKEKKLNRKRKYLESHPEVVKQKHGRKSEEETESEEESECGEGEAEGAGEKVEEDKSGLPSAIKAISDQVEHAEIIPVSKPEVTAPVSHGL